MKAHAYPVDDAQADRRKLAALLDETLDRMPANSDAAEFPEIARVLVGETLASAVRRGLLPVAGQIQAQADCRAALEAVPHCRSLVAFQGAAKAALRNAMLPED